MAGEVVYFVSDTHLGDGSAAERFRYPVQLMGLLERIAAEPTAQLVLLGDFLELWSASLEGIMLHHAPLLQAVARLAATHTVTFVVGNHDCLPWYQYLGLELGALRITEQFTAARGALVAVHGHQFDPFNQVTVTEEGKVRAPATRRLVQLLGFLERVGGERAGGGRSGDGAGASRTGVAIPDWRAWLDERAAELEKHSGQLLRLARYLLDRESPGERGYPAGESIYEEGARRFMRSGARYVVMGHTHHPLQRNYGARRYVNSGSWVSERYPPTYARFAGGRLELLEGESHTPYVPPAAEE